MEDNNYIAHYGVKNQQWGVKHGPPYPVRRGSGGKPKKTTIVKSRLKESFEKRKADVAEKKEKTAAERHEALRKEIIKNPKKIYKNKDEFTKEELEEMIKEIEFDRKIQDVKISEVQRGMDSYKRLQSAVNTTANLASDASRIYSVASSIHNALVDSGRINDKKWPTLGGSNNSNEQKKPSEGTQSPKNEQPKKDDPFSANVQTGRRGKPKN